MKSEPQEIKCKLMNFSEISDLLEKEETLIVKNTYFLSGILELTQSLRDLGFMLKIIFKGESAITFMFSRKRLISISFREDLLIISNQNQ